MATFIRFHSPHSTLHSPQSSSTSDSSTNTSFSDQDINLASRNPKKRAGRKKFKETRHPIYWGVRRRDSGKWVCEVRDPNNKTRVWLGTYPTADMAARAHDVAALAMKGRSACLNFADSVWRLPVPESSNVKDIQKTAVEAAEAFRPVECDVAEVEVEVEDRKELFMDEEVVFGMPGFLANMAEGLMLPPPQTVGYESYDNGEDDVEFSFDASLWSF